jgi:hypothetical protein
MCASSQPLNGADSPDAVTHYRVPLRSQVSDEPTFYRPIAVYGPKDLTAQLEQLRIENPDYDLGTPQRVAA